ncbi:MAG: autotransporter outer membrane beta-barrel domain-containing protein [Gammaproteobacteria bacterium]|nr:autotransporter outer membrane beta-barrel domain-containing protein [Gammaproteobacteria bacterium]
MDKRIRTTTIVLLAGYSLAGNAANQEFQDFFFNACVNAVGGLAVRCAETQGGFGDLSGDSESSLNPSQSLSGSDAALVSALQRGQEVREHLQRNAEDDADEERVSIGPFSLLINGRRSSTEATRIVDLDSERSYQMDQTGAELGLDFRASDAITVGGWLQWESSDLRFDSEDQGVNFAPLGDAGNIDSDGLGVTVYLSAQLGGNAYVDGSIGYTSNDYVYSRNSVFQESTRTVAQTNVRVRGETSGQVLAATLNFGRTTGVGAWSVTPIAGLTYIGSESDAYTEQDLSGSGLSLTVADSSRTVLIGQLGVSVNRAISMNGWVLLPQARIEYIRELDNERSESEVRFVNDASANRFRLLGDNPDADRIDLAIGLAGVFRNGWIPYVEYQITTAGDNFDRYRIAAGIRVEL